MRGVAGEEGICPARRAVKTREATTHGRRCEFRLAAVPNSLLPQANGCESTALSGNLCVKMEWSGHITFPVLTVRLTQKLCVQAQITTEQECLTMFSIITPN